ncbi:MAG: uracil-DNA glycosylase [Endomicrobium sp.]|jgi:DNA polymerase|nr:uracil-DNA glycosylase [Endomicrobium sp.]
MKQPDYLKILNLSKRTLEEYLNWGETEIAKMPIDKIISTEESVKTLSPKKQSKSVLSPKEKIETLRRTIDSCKECFLGNNRLNAVIGVGSPTADLMFVGEGPGFDEDHKGEPFVGKAGQLLTKIIEAMGYTRENIYITNIVKCHPMIDSTNPEKRSNDRPPTPLEMETCKHYLDEQIEIIKPKIIVALGASSAKCLLYSEESISKIRGIVKEYKGIKLMPTYHPAALLRNPSLKKFVWDDMKIVMHYLDTGKI